MSQRERADPPSRGHRILLVDDEETVLFSLGRFLQHHGYAVDTAAFFTQAVALLDSAHYDVVITDLRLEGSDDTSGLDLIAQVARLEPAPISILLTAYGTPDVLEAATNLGASRVVAKPVALDDLLCTLREALI